jgi:hypothetical protein
MLLTYYEFGGAFKTKILHETYFHNFRFSEWTLSHLNGCAYGEAAAEKYRAQVNIGRKK